jgi:hypothetical protein
LYTDKIEQFKTLPIYTIVNCKFTPVISIMPRTRVNTGDFSEALIELVRQYPLLYNKTSCMHSKQDARANAWLEIATLLELAL